MTRFTTSTLSRRSMLSVMGLTGAAAALTACGAPGASTEGAVNNAYKQADLQIPQQYQGRTPVLFWSPWTAGPQDAINEMLRQFNESQSDIVAVSESQESYQVLNQKLTAALQARQVPDVVAFPELQWLQFYFSGVFAELDPYFNADWSLDTYLDAYVGEGVAAGKTYVVPFARSNPLFYFNRELFAKAGLPEEGPKTWDDLAEYGPELAKITVSGKPLQTMAFGATDNWFGQAGVWAFGGSFSKEYEITVDEAPAVEWLEWQRSFIHEQKLGYMAKAAMTDYTTGLVAACHGSTASLRGAMQAAKFDIGVAFMLGKKSERTQVPTGGSGLSIIKADSKDRQDAAAELFKFLAKPEIAAYWHASTGYVPIVKTAHDTSIVKDLVKENPNFGVALEQLPNAKTADRITWFQAATDQISGAMARVYGDNVPATEALAGIRPRLEEIMADNREDLERVVTS